MSDYTYFAGIRVVTMSLSLPLIGLWTADVAMATDASLPSTGTLTHGNLSLAGAVYRQGTLGGQTRARLVAGRGGWSMIVPARGYQSPFGVLVSLVLNELAAEIGETVAVSSDGSLGNWWHRPATRAGAVLRAAAGASWWADATGTMQVGPRAGGSVTTPFQVTAWDGAGGILDIAADDVASWQPGVSFSSPLVPQLTASSVRHTVTNDGTARMRVMVS